MTPDTIQAIRRHLQCISDLLAHEEQLDAKAKGPSTSAPAYVYIQSHECTAHKEELPFFDLPCPTCGAKMKWSKNSKTKQWFLGCTLFRSTNCKGGLNMAAAFRVAEEQKKCLCTARVRIDECPVGRRRGNHPPGASMTGPMDGPQGDAASLELANAENEDVPF